jgi:hypothetical protein
VPWYTGMRHGFTAIARWCPSNATTNPKYASSCKMRTCIGRSHADCQAQHVRQRPQDGLAAWHNTHPLKQSHRPELCRHRPLPPHSLVAAPRLMGAPHISTLTGQSCRQLAALAIDPPPRDLRHQRAHSFTACLSPPPVTNDRCTTSDCRAMF